MILLDIIIEDEEVAGRISNFLIAEKYAIQTHIDTNTILTLQGNKKTVRLFFITKSLLYSIIESEVKKNFLSPGMIIYATPVSHINKEFGDVLRKGIQ